MTRPMTAIALTAALVAGAGAALAQQGPGPGPMGPMAGPMRPMPLDFAAIDTDGNGSLSRAELQARAVSRLARADANNDGALDRAELVAVLSDGRGQLVALFSVDPAEAMADRLLALAGGTESGKVEVAALADMRVNRLLAFADTDHDAAISKAEADAMQAKVADWHGDRHGRRGGHDRPKGPPVPDAPDAPDGQDG